MHMRTSIVRHAIVASAVFSIAGLAGCAPAPNQEESQGSTESNLDNTSSAIVGVCGSINQKVSAQTPTEKSLRSRTRDRRHGRWSLGLDLRGRR